MSSSRKTTTSTSNARVTTDPSQKPSYELVLSNGNVAPGETLILNGISLEVYPGEIVSIIGPSAPYPSRRSPRATR